MTKRFTLTFLITKTITETCEIIMDADSKEEAEYTLKKGIKNGSIKESEYDSHEVINEDVYARVLTAEEV